MEAEVSAAWQSHNHLLGARWSSSCYWGVSPAIKSLSTSQTASFLPTLPQTINIWCQQTGHQVAGTEPVFITEIKPQESISLAPPKMQWTRHLYHAPLIWYMSRVPEPPPSMELHPCRRTNQTMLSIIFSPKFPYARSALQQPHTAVVCWPLQCQTLSGLR